jgi:phosphomannomutase
MLSDIKFGTDGWRAVIGDSFTFANVERATVAIGAYTRSAFSLDELSQRPILIGYDTRFLADQFAERAARVLLGMGLHVRVVDRDVPTPCIAWATQDTPTLGALQFTASHNPPEYCGIKYIPPYAGPATSDITRAIAKNLEHCLEGSVLSLEQLEYFDPRAAYLEALSRLLNMEKIRSSGLRIVFDALFSTSRGYLDVFLEREGLLVKKLHCYRDPLFGGGMPEPRPEYLSELALTLRQGDYDLGIATDGDADRFGVMDETGSSFSSNQVLCMLTRHLFKNKGQRGTIVRTVSTTHMLNHQAAAYGLPVVETPVGFKYVGEEMRIGDVMIGGEESGGVSIKGHIPEKDGILGDLLVIEMLAYEQKSLSEIWSELQDEVGVRLFERRANFKFSSIESARISEFLQSSPFSSLCGRKIERIDSRDGYKYYLSADSWILLRPSGTEPLIRLYAESNEPSLVVDMMQEFSNKLELFLAQDETNSMLQSSCMESLSPATS